MVTYSILWPSGNLLQQGLDGSREEWDFKEAARYGLYGSLGYVDQLVFAPFNISQFFLGMSLVEGRPLDEALDEWDQKFLSTWMVSATLQQTYFPASVSHL
ncbi:hypothetical protein E2C01_000228 [Portunus trituberculatus]|uniref:Uncharacterized protein n=1 Tax=Portunus trituberculatus TaxID=210409 RepID=A0A5B7CJ28_PORTR|nr:hypothetical protein [Portunus trituberculatus]